MLETCAKCGRRAFGIQKVKRESIWGIYWYMRFIHWVKRNKKKKRLYHYTKLIE